MKIIWRSTWLESTSAQDVGTRRLHRTRNGKNLFLALNRAWTGHNCKITATNLNLILALAHGHNSILWVEAAVGTLERIRDTCNTVNNLKTCKQVNIYLACIAYETDDGLHLALRDMHTHILRLEPMDKIILLSLGYSMF